MRPQLTFDPDRLHPARGRLLLYGLHEDDPSALAAAAAALGLPGEPTTACLAIPSPDGVTVVDHPVWATPVGDALPALLAVGGDRGPSWRGITASVRVWGLATALAVRLVRAQRLVPRLVAGDEQVCAAWGVDADAPDVAAATSRLARAMPAAAHAAAVGPDRVHDPAALLAAYLDAVADVLARDPDRPPSTRPRARVLPWTARWVEALADPADPTVPLRDGGADLVAAVEGWLTRDAADGTTVLTLHPPEGPQGSWHLAFAVRGTDDDDVHPAAEVWADGDSPLADALLAGLSRAARAFPPLQPALAEPAPTGIDLDLDQAWDFLAEAAPLLRGGGVDVVVPRGLSDEGVVARVRVGAVEEDDPAAGEPVTGAVWEVLVDDEVVDGDELAALLDADDPLVWFRGRWVRIDEQARQAGALAGRQDVLGLGEALALALAGSTGPGWFGDGTAAATVVAEGRIADLLERLRAAQDLPEVPDRPEGFVGELRPYQRRGVAWLQGMADLGFGAVLADAMGLGKTVQLIAMLVSRPGPFLVVCPTSVVGNWLRELARFAPDLPLIRHHGTDRPTDLTLQVTSAEPDAEPTPGPVVVTSYGTLRRDADLLSGITWDVVTLDEAQQVKNPRTAAAKAVRRLKANATIALTGTPLENRLADLWAVLDATNPGMLGSQAAFNRRFAGPVERDRDPEAAARLRRLVAPFVLRRTKDQPEVAADLPDKIERTVPCALTVEQAELYRRVTAEALEEVRRSDGIARRGRILALLTALKQITNHPAHYLGEGPEQLPGRSGKLAALQEIVAEATAAGDALLVFTQYTAMGRLLAAQLEADLGVAIPFLHGGLSARARDRLVADFQEGGSPVLIASTRAGGLGLNLTAATHVVHYDRWWNPAVEDQATDRAHRIGQTRTVEVHKLVTAGTIEERIAQLLDRKRELADAVVAAGETWITELDDEALADLVALSADATILEVGEE